MTLAAYSYNGSDYLMSGSWDDGTAYSKSEAYRWGGSSFLTSTIDHTIDVSYLSYMYPFVINGTTLMAVIREAALSSSYVYKLCGGAWK